MVEKICPFMSRPIVESMDTQNPEILQSCEFFIRCQKEKCMAWEEERRISANYAGTETKVIPGYCRLIEKE